MSYKAKVKRFFRTFSLIRYGVGQHELICEATNTGKDYLDDGCTAYESVCVLMYKLDVAKEWLQKQDNKEASELLNFLNAHQDSDEFAFIPLYGDDIEKSGV